MPENRSDTIRNYNDIGIVSNLVFSIVPWFCWAVFIKEFSKCPENMNVLFPTMLAVVPGFLGGMAAMFVAAVARVPSSSPNRLFFHAAFGLIANLSLFLSYFALPHWGDYVFGNCF